MQTTSGALAQWSSSKDAPAIPAATGFYLLALRAAVVPTKDTPALVTSLNNLISAVTGIGAGNVIDTHDAQVLAGYVADTRQPAWARLAIALLIDDVSSADDLAEAAETLAAVPGLVRLPVGRKAFDVLGAVPRAHLSSSHSIVVPGPRRHLSLEDFNEVTGYREFTDCTKLINFIDWADTPLEAALDVVEGQDWLFDFWDGLAMLCDWASATAAITSDATDVLDIFATSFGIGHRVDTDSRPQRSIADFRITTVLDDAQFTAVLDQLTAQNTTGAQRLIGVLVNSRPQPTAEMLVATSASAESAWVLVDGYKCQAVGRDILTRLVTTVVGTTDHDPAVVVALLAQLANTYDSSWINPVWETGLGIYGDLVVAAVAKKLARSYGYTHPAEEYDLVRDLPVSLKERIMSLENGVISELVRTGQVPGHRPDDMVVRVFTIGSEALDQARAVLYELDYTPPACLVPGGDYYLVTTLRSGLLDEARHPDNDALVQRNNRWLRCLSAPAAVALARQSAQYNAQCKASDTLVRSLKDLLDDALDHAATPQGRSCLIEAITTAEYAYLPTSQSLAAYADSVAKVIAHQS